MSTNLRALRSRWKKHQKVLGKTQTLSVLTLSFKNRGQIESEHFYVSLRKS